MLKALFLFYSPVDHVFPHIAYPVLTLVLEYCRESTIISTWKYFLGFFFFFLNLSQLSYLSYFTANKRKGLQELIAKDYVKTLTYENGIIFSMEI